MLFYKRFIPFFVLQLFYFNLSFSQEFKIIQKEKNSIIIEFTLDTNFIKKSTLNQDSIDFRKFYYCTNIKNKPFLPIFHYTFQLENSSVSYKIENETKTIIPIKSITYCINNKKRNDSLDYFSQTNAEVIQLSDVYSYKGFLGQNLRILPIIYDTVENKLICLSKIRLRIYQNEDLHFFTSNKTLTNSYTLNKSNYFDFRQNTSNRNKSISNDKVEILVICQDSNLSNATKLASWKNQKGLKTSIINLKNVKEITKIKSLIDSSVVATPSFEYIILLGNHDEIPAFNYGLIDGDNYYSDSYYGQLTNDLYPELYVGRITGTKNEIENIINKSIYYEKDNFEGDWMLNSAGIGSNEGLGEGDQGEADWQHLRNIRSKLSTFGFKNIYEFYDGDHGILDKTGAPDKNEILSVINEGASLLNYTGHGDNNLFLTSQLSSNDLETKLTNSNKNPFVISVACNNGKFTSETGCIAETFLNGNYNYVNSGAIGFCGSSILMDWAPPMLTQDEVINSIISSDSAKIRFSIGELFYSSQAKMLDKYGTSGNGVMQTWILFGDPSLDLKTKLPQPLTFSFEVFPNEKKLLVNSDQNNVLLGVSSLNQYVSSLMLKKGLNEIFLDSLTDNFVYTFTKPNYITKQVESKTNSLTGLNKNDELFIFPNPVNTNEISEIKIATNIKVTKYNLLDLYGKIIINKEVNTNSDNIIKLPSMLPKGVYFIQIFDNNNNITTKKIELI
jgi:gingipain R